MIKKITYPCVALSCVILASCAPSGRYSIRHDKAPRRPKSVANVKNAVPKNEARSRYGNPKSYVVAGKRYYVLSSAKNFKQRGIASWYGIKFHGHLTSNREPYDMYKMTAAMPTIPLPSYVRVTNLKNGRQVIVRVNDRGPFAPGRIIDLSYAAARKLDVIKSGTARVEVVALSTNAKKSTPESFVPSFSEKMYLQIGSYSQIRNAERVAKKIKALTHKNVFLSANRSGTLHRVRIGPLYNDYQSGAIKRQLASNGYGNAILVKD